jgi:hypothetical protein
MVSRGGGAEHRRPEEGCSAITVRHALGLGLGAAGQAQGLRTRNGRNDSGDHVHTVEKTLPSKQASFHPPRLGRAVRSRQPRPQLFYGDDRPVGSQVRLA